MTSLKILNILNLSKTNKSPFLKLYNIYQYQHLSTTRFVKSATNNENETKKKKTVPIPKITLISPDESIQILSLEEAQKISKRRDLKLVKIIDLDTKTQRPIYKLMTGAEYHAEDLKQREEKKKKNNNQIKGEKLLLLNSKINEHDLQARIKNILKWINKKYEVRIVISGDSPNNESSEKVYKEIELNVKSDGRIVQKRAKGNEIKFQILPLKTEKQKSDETL